MKKKIFGLILCVAIAASLGVTSSVTSAFAHDTTIEQWGLEHFSELDVGIYWFTEKNQVIPTQSYTVDRSKPTIIYTHGWKPADSHLREGFSLNDKTDPAMTKKGFKTFADEGYDSEFYNYYLEQGYNVGVFYWNQIATGSALTDWSPEERIWCSNGGKNMLYKTFSSVNDTKGRLTKQDDPTNPKESVAMLYAHELIKWLGKDYKQMLHLTGHSMGGQLTLAVGEALCVMVDDGDLSEEFLPDRLTLMDPYFDCLVTVTGTIDHTHKPVQKAITGTLAGNAAETCAYHGIPIEAYGVNETMVFRNYNIYALGKAADGPEMKTIMEATKKLGDNCAWVYMKSLSQYGGFDPTHVMSVDYYFSSAYMDPVQSEEGLTVPSARMSISDLKMNVGRCYIQTVGKGEGNPAYYKSGSFHLVNFYTKDISELKANEKGYIYGEIKVDHRNGKSVVVKLIDKDNEAVAEANVDLKGNYHFSNVKEGTYSIKIYADTIKVDEIEEVKVVKGSVKPVQAETKEIVMGGDKLLLYSVLALCGVVVLVCVGGLIVAIVKKAKKKNA